MNKTHAHDEKLLDYLDGTIAGNERKSLEDQINNSAELKARLEELRALDIGLRSIKIEQPSKNFTQLVMNKLDQYPIQTKSISTRNGILLLVGVLVAVGIGSLLVAGGAFDGTSAIEINQNIIPNKYLQNPLPTIPFNGKLVVNIIIILNLALAFMVLDRAILKPWFERRARMHEMG